MREFVIKPSFEELGRLTQSIYYDYSYDLIIFYWGLGFNREEFYNQRLIAYKTNGIDLSVFYKGYLNSFNNLDFEVTEKQKTKMIEEILDSTILIML